MCFGRGSRFAEAIMRTDVCAAFAASFLIRIARLFPQELNLRKTAKDVEELASLLESCKPKVWNYAALNVDTDASITLQYRLGDMLDPFASCFVERERANTFHHHPCRRHRRVVRRTFLVID